MRLSALIILMVSPSAAKREGQIASYPQRLNSDSALIEVSGHFVFSSRPMLLLMCFTPQWGHSAVIHAADAVFFSTLLICLLCSMFHLC